MGPRSASGPWLVQSQAPDSLYTDFAEGAELFRHSTKKTVLSVCSLYKKMGLSSDFATAIHQVRRVCPGKACGRERAEGIDPSPRRLRHASQMGRGLIGRGR